MDTRSRKGFVIAALLLGILMASMDNTIVATAIGTIVSELGDFEKFIWVTSAYMIASVAGTPIFGKLSDMYGRKRFYVAGLIIFIGGSILCGTANTMVQLAIYRAIQGIGGGALMPIAFTIIFDIYPPQQRGKISGLFGAVFGLSSVFGPLLGAYLTDYVDWRWIFYVNIPLGLLSLFFILRYYFESIEHRKLKIDWLGAFLLVASIVSLMFALEFGGKQYAWNSTLIIGLFASFVILTIVFIFVESKVAEPIISLQLFKSRLFAASQAIGFLYGSVFIVATMYIPVYIQGVFGGSATNGGLILMPMMLGSVAGSQFGGRFATKLRYRTIMLVSGALFLTGVILLSTLSATTPRLIVTLYMIITGVGVGISFPLLSLSAVHGLEMRQRGSANSAVAFFRMIGMTLGITIYGTIQNNRLVSQMKEAFPNFQQMNKIGDARALLQPEVRKHIPEMVLNKLSTIFADSISYVFSWSIISVVLAVFMIVLMGNSRMEMGAVVNKSVTKANE